MKIRIKVSDTAKGSLTELTEAVKAADRTDLDVSHIVLVKDNFSMTFEREILAGLGRAGTFNVDVLSFSRLLARLLTRGADKAYLTSAAGIMTVARIVLEKREEFTCYRSVAGVMGFAEKLYELIQSLKNCSVTPDALRERAASADGHLASKLHDILLVYDAYEDYIRYRFYDASTKLDLLNALIEKSGWVARSHFYLADFDSYAGRDYAVLKTLMARAASVTLCCVADEGNAAYPNDAFRRLTRLAEEVGKECVETERRETQLPPDFAFLRRELYAFRPAEKRFARSVGLYALPDVSEEVLRVAEDIRRRVAGGLRYNRIGIACQDLDGYRLTFERVFRDFDIPYFLDSGLRAAEHPGAKYLLLLLELAVRGDGSPAPLFISLAKNPFSGIVPEDADRFENYCLKYGVRYGVLKRPFRYPSEDLEPAERVRCELVRQIGLLRMPAAARAEAFYEAVAAFFREADFAGRAEAYRKALEEAHLAQAAEYTAQLAAKVESAASQVAAALGGQAVTLKEYAEILANGLSTIKISLIPMFLDNVFVGSVNDCKYLDADVLYVIGANDALLPVVKKDLGLLTEADVDAVTGDGVEIEPRLAAVNRNERFHAHQLLLLPKERLNVSWARVGADGRECAPSRIVTELQRLFRFGAEDGGMRPFRFGTPKHAGKWLTARLSQLAEGGVEEPDAASLLLALEQHNDAGAVKRGFEIVRRQRAEAPLKSATALFFPDGKLSATKVEEYYACPFRSFLTRGLLLAPREEYGFSALDVGTVLHKIVELYTVRSAGIPYDRKASDALVAELAGELLGAEAYAHYRESSVERLAIRRLTGEAQRVCFELLGQFKRSAFQVKAQELYFGGGEVPGLQLPRAELVGKIDRLDTYLGYGRVVDYKTGRTDSGLTELYTGRKLQLYAYQQVAAGLGLKPAGAFYFPVHNDFTEENAAPDYRLTGSCAETPELISAMDGGLYEEGASRVLPVSVGKDGGLKPERKRLNLVTEAQLASFGAYAEIVCRQAAENLAAGDIRVSPYEDACKYCPCGSVCNFACFGERARKIGGAVTAAGIEEAVALWQSGQQNKSAR